MLSVTYTLVDPSELPDGAVIDVQEDRGRVHFLVSSALTLAQAMEALNVGAKEVMRGGHWFQEWKGEIHTWAGSIQRRPSLMLATHDESSAA